MFVMHPNLVVVFTVIKVEGGKEGGGGWVSSRVHKQQFCISQVMKQNFTFLHFSKIEVVQNV